MKYQIIEEADHVVLKEAGQEIFYLQKGDAVIIDDKIYIVDNKHLDYDENIFQLWVELDE